MTLTADNNSFPANSTGCYGSFRTSVPLGPFDQ